MKIRSIRLENVRRFTDPVVIDGIGDGLNVLCEPNEHGKSTVFDALQALFFTGYRAQPKQIKALRPHAGGAPAVAVEIETCEGIFRIEKQWLSGQRAQVWQGDRLIAQADEAQAWIDRLVGGGDAGPSGLLWVRQGETRLDPKEAGPLEARRDLMSSVTGEVEAMTGGRRMDAVLKRCREELSGYLTDTGRPRAGGPFKAAADMVAELVEQRDGLARSAEELRGALDRRRAVRKEMAELENPAEAEARKARLDEAAAAHRAAEKHAESVERAAEAVQLARLEVERTEGELARLRAARDELRAATTEAERTAAARATAGAARAESEAALAEAEAAARAAATAAAEANRVLQAALRQEAAAEGQKRREELADRIGRAEAQRAAAEAAAAEAKIGPDEATMRRLDKLAHDFAAARAVHDSAAADLTMSYAAGAEGKVILDGAPVPHEARLPIPTGAVLDLAGLGRLTIRPGRGGGDEAAVRKAEQALARALEGVGAAGLEEARAAADARAAAAERQRGAADRLEALAPDGIDALRTALATIPAVEPVEGLPSAAEAQAAATRASEALAEAERRRETARKRADTDRETLARAEAAEQSAGERLARAGEKAQHDSDAEDRLVVALAGQRGALSDAESRHRSLAAAAPDLAAAAAALARARSAVEGADRDLQDLRTERATLDERIAARSDAAVEEELADAETRLAAAQATFGRIEAEVALLQTLKAALEDARSEARERYFEPVLRELEPLLRLLWPEAELRFDDATLLPSALVRRGRAEEMDILSGGTQEQIAMMVRLAFARMLAANGRAAPVILDDALVYTDDDRIERMFEALHRQAGDLQIIVFSCRQRAFRELGGRKLRLVQPTRVLEPAE